jgi:hypothetical protein
MTIVIQEETAGCGIASVANIVGISYADAKAKARELGISAEDIALYSDTGYVRRLLAEYGVKTSPTEIPFISWSELPKLALLSIKFREENGRTLWHWVVFKRALNGAVVLDSAAYLEENVRTDYESMNPKWYIEVSKT